MTTFCGLDYCVFDDLLASHILLVIYIYIASDIHRFASDEVLSMTAYYGV